MNKSTHNYRCGIPVSSYSFKENPTNDFEGGQALLRLSNVNITSFNDVM